MSHKSDIDMDRKYIVQQGDLFKNYKLEDKAKKIISLTPTNYKIKIINKT